MPDRAEYLCGTRYQKLLDQLVEAKAEIKRLQEDAKQLHAFRDHGVFGMRINGGETLADAANRWYAEFDDAREKQTAEIEWLRKRLEEEGHLANFRPDDHACKVCGETPDKCGFLVHGKGCYTQSEEGGGEEYVGP